MAQAGISHRDDGAVRVITLDVDAQGAAALAGVSQALHISDAIRAVVITGAEALNTLAGLDDLGGDAGLFALCAQVETLPVPVISALSGAALGAGAELALAAHYRVGAGSAALGLVDIDLGLPPMAGTVQRLARIAGLETAADLALTGRVVPAAELSDLGLLDARAGDAAEAPALVFARALLDEGLGPRPASQRRGALAVGRDALAQLQMIRDAVPAAAMTASHVIVDSLDSAVLLPFAAAQLRELDGWDRSRRDPDSRALVHLTQAEARIDPILMTVTGGQRELTGDGVAIVQRLREALTQAGQALRDQGLSAEDVDGGAVAWGLPRGPFGGAPRGGDLRVGERLVAALVAEGARLIEVEAVRSAGDVDVLAVQGLGLPRRSGGPMFLMRERGLARLLGNLRDWAALDGIWAPAPVLERALTDPGVLSR